MLAEPKITSGAAVRWVASRAWPPTIDAVASTSALWLFAHRGLGPNFHQDPKRFVETLEGRGAVDYLERTWRSALEAAGGLRSPERAPLTYGIDRPAPGLAIVWMRFDQVSKTGEPWHARFIVRDPDPNASNGYARMFMLEHSEYGSELAGKLDAIACESLPDGRHRNFGVTMAPSDEQAFDRLVLDTIRNDPTPAAQFLPGK